VFTSCYAYFPLAPLDGLAYCDIKRVVRLWIDWFSPTGPAASGAASGRKTAISANVQRA
jgi:hypothetical protein